MTPEDVSDFYERFGFPVYRRCLRILGDAARAEDALQEVFVRVLRYGGYRGGSLLAWLLRIADRVALDQVARDRRYAPARPEGSPEPEPPFRVSEAPEAARLLSEVLALLPRPLREVAVLIHLDGMTQVEIAETLGCSAMTVRRRIRALHRQARQFDGYVDEEVGHENPA